MTNKDRLIQAERSIPILQAELARIALIVDPVNKEPIGWEMRWAGKRLLNSLNHLVKFVEYAQKEVESKDQL